MIYLFFIVITFLLGRGALRALYGNSKTQDFTYADSIPVGIMLVIGLAEAAHMVAVILGRSFSDCVKLFLGGLVVLMLAAAAVLVWKLRREKKTLTEREAGKLKVMRQNHYFLLFVVGLVILLQLVAVFSGSERYLAGDMTAETVNSILVTDTIYQINPMTGAPYTVGMPLRLKILCLPTLYAICCELFDMSAVSVVWTAVPACTVIGCYAAFWTVAKALFKEDARKKYIFILFVSLILWFGSYLYGVDGFALRYSGFRGVSIRILILVPYTFGLVLRKKWKLVVLCVLAEACIVWTLYGMGVCMAVAVGMVSVGMLADKFLKRGGEEASE